MTAILNVKTTVNECIQHWAETVPEKEIVTFFDSYGRQCSCHMLDFYIMSGKFAAMLRREGFKPGDIICNAVPNSLERLVTDFGTMLAGCVGINCQVVEKNGADFWNMVRLSDCKAVIMPVRDDNPVYRLLKRNIPSDIHESGFLHGISLPEALNLKSIFLVDRYTDNSKATYPQLPSFLTYLKEQTNELEVLNHPVIKSDLAYIFQTSGSMGYCKLVPRTHESILNICRAFPSPKANILESKRFSDRPFGWIGGFCFHLISSATVFVAQDNFDGRQTHDLRSMWKKLEEENCVSAFMLPSSILEMMSEFGDKSPEFKLDLIITGGQPVTKQIVDALGVLTKCMIISYASTETSAITNQLIVDKGQFKDFMCGRPCGDSQVRIVDEHLNDVPPGQKGTLLVKSSTVFDGYLNYNGTAPVFTPDGWYKTGDSGWLDPNGVLFIYERSDNAINHGSIVVYPSWPEGIIKRHPDVSEAVVVGLPDGYGGSKLCACVVLKKGSTLSANELTKFYDESFVEWDQKEFLPSLDYLEFFEEIPKTFNSKPSYRRLKQTVLNRLSNDCK